MVTVLCSFFLKVSRHIKPPPPEPAFKLQQKVRYDGREHQVIGRYYGYADSQYWVTKKRHWVYTLVDLTRPERYGITTVSVIQEYVAPL